MTMTRPIGMPPRENLITEDGLTFVRGMRDGRFPIPPMIATLNLDLVHVEPGEVVFVGEPQERHMNPLGSIHGGWAAGVLDSALGCAVHTLLEAGTGFTTVEMKVGYVRALQPSVGRVRCEARIIHRGGRIAMAEARVVGSDGTLYAHGTETCLLFPIAKAA